MKIIVGLGNPGAKYLKTFHNAGFMTVDAVAQKLGFKFKLKDCKALIAEGYIGGEKVAVAMPQTYMNLSGESVNMLMGKYKAKLEDLLVIFDDADIALGQLRIRGAGSGGTHNGMRNIVACVKSEAFARVRIGIGRPPEGMPIDAYVLADIPKSAQGDMFDCFMRASDAAIMWAKGATLDEVMRSCRTGV